MRRRGAPVGTAVLVALSVTLTPAALTGQTCTAPIPTGSCSANTSTTITIGTLLELTLNSTTTPLAAPATADYDAGYVATTGPTVTVAANRAWTLDISAAAATWSATSVQPGVTARPNKPAGDLEWSSSPAGPFVGLTVSGAAVRTGAAGGAAATTVYYHTLYDWTRDTPGSYSLSVIFTITAP